MTGTHGLAAAGCVWSAVAGGTAAADGVVGDVVVGDGVAGDGVAACCAGLHLVYILQIWICFECAAEILSAAEG